MSDPVSELIAEVQEINKEPLPFNILYGSTCPKCLSTVVDFGDGPTCVNDECWLWEGFYNIRRRHGVKPGEPCPEADAWFVEQDKARGQ